MSLRRSVSIALVVLAAVALFAAGSLILVSNYVVEATSEVSASLDSILVLQRIEINLLTHPRAVDGLARANLESRVLRRLEESQQHVGSLEEKIALDAVREALQRYFRQASEMEPVARQESAELEQAFRALERLADINMAQAAQAQAVVARGKRIANGVGVGTAWALLLGVGGVVIWLWKVAFRPMFGIRNAMSDFAKGKRTSRAPEIGPEELRSIASQFNQMADSLLRQYEDQLSFLAAVAHDVRSPLAALRMATEAISPDRSPTQERVQSTLVLINRQLALLDSQIGDLLDAWRIEAGRLELHPREYDACSVARDVFELFQTASPNHRLELRVPPVAVPIRCDPLRMQQVLNNLVDNALKYSLQEATIQIAVETAENETIFRVSDRGVGIPAEELPFIFEPFRRTRMSSQHAPGFGLGLSVARRIVEAHHGRIEVESEVGQGSTFRVYLPMQETDGTSTAK